MEIICFWHRQWLPKARARTSHTHSTHAIRSLGVGRNCISSRSETPSTLEQHREREIGKNDCRTWMNSRNSWPDGSVWQSLPICKLLNIWFETVETLQFLPVNWDDSYLHFSSKDTILVFVCKKSCFNKLKKQFLCKWTLER